MKTHCRNPRPGFTLVEVLVAVVIIAILATVTFLVSRKMVNNAKAAKAIGNMREVGAMVVAHAADNSGRLPSPREYNGTDPGQPMNWHWNQQVASMQFPDVPKSIIAWDKDWWWTNEPLAKNPQMPEALFQTYYSGYAMNLFIAENHYQKSNTRDREMILRHQTPLAAIPSPERTPQILPHWNWHTGDLLSGTRLNNPENSRHVLSDGRMGVVFLDGHVENLRFANSRGEALPVCEYAERGLHQMPKL